MHCKEADKDDIRGHLTSPPKKSLPKTPANRHMAVAKTQIHTHPLYIELMDEDEGRYSDILNTKIDAKKNEKDKQVAQQRGLILNLKQVRVCVVARKE